MKNMYDIPIIIEMGREKKVEKTRDTKKNASKTPRQKSSGTSGHDALF